MNRPLFAICVIVAAAAATVIHVPSEQPTIQEGLSSAQYGDTVLVAPGYYEENIDWPATDGIRLYSSAGPDSTVISGGGNGRVIAIGSGITRATEIRGFEISAGKANSAAGIYCEGSPVIAGNRIRQNESHGSSNHGGGIFCGYNSAPLITGNEISDNICSDTSTWNYGAGIYVDMGSVPEICYNYIARNECSDGYWNYGAGIYCDLRSTPAIWQNIIAGNTTKRGDRGHGAGIHVDLQSHALIFSNLITGNINQSGLWNYGAGIKVTGAAAIVNNTIVENVCSGGNWNDGGGIYVDYQDSALVKNNIITDNSAGSGGGIYNAGFIYNAFNDVWNNTGGNYYGCSAGPGDISQDPLFTAGAHGTCYLAQVAAGQPQTSPCVDAGDTLLWTEPYDLDSMLRTWTTRTDSVPDESALDMGYHYPEFVMTGIAEWRLPAPAPAARTFTISPNPCRNSAVVHLNPRLLGSSNPLLSLFDASGRLILQSSVCNLQSEIPLHLNGLTAGVYLVRFSSSSGSAEQKLVIRR